MKDVLQGIYSANSPSTGRHQARIGNSGQIVLATNTDISSSKATIHTFEKINDKWVEKFAGTEGTIGRYGFAPYHEKKEGDGKTPTGIFSLGPVFSYKGAKVSTKMEYWVASENDYWIDDVKSPQYNRWVTGSIDPKTDGVSRENMKRVDDKYKYGICVQYNMDQIKGKGSVIVFRVLVGESPTAGGIAVPEDKLTEIIGWLDPAKKPLIFTGTEKVLRSQPVSKPGPDKNDEYVWKKETYAPVSK